MSETARRVLTAAVCLLMGCAVGVVVTWCTATGVFNRTQQTADERQGSEKYNEIMDLVDQYFIGDNVDMTAVDDGMAAGMIAGLGDRWSYYVSAEEYQNYISGINNSYVGIGVTIMAKLNEDGEQIGFEITDVSKDGPAEGKGILAGDILIRVDGTDVTQSSVTEVKSLVTGEEGTTVNLTLLHDGEEINMDVERRALTVIPASGRLLEGSVGYIVIDNFDAGCSETVQGLVEDLRAQGAQSLLFDVRNNPGGLKAELTDLLDYLLPEGVVFHTINYAGEEDIVTSDASCVDMPMAVLVNASSYSAAEYFACALQEYGKGAVVGEHTFGKGYYQVGLQLSDGSCVNLSIGKYFTPNGESLIDVGVTPDVEVLLDEEAQRLLAQRKLDPADDPQLQAALGTLPSKSE
ncbi:MAG: PDZ domain-containing protein [Oscillospiraceae bacterium]|nr:PDZ domain-containing protein [Oscillospiraceae bacterium]